MARQRNRYTSGNLRSAYRRTSYRACTPVGEIRIRIGYRNARLDRLLDQHAAVCWGYVTAVNPFSQPHAAEFNRRAIAALERVIRQWGCVYFTGRGVGDDKRWPEEPSFLVLGITRDSAHELGRRFRQNAVVVGSRGGAAELLWCAPSVEGHRGRAPRRE